jgi:hypothetical protein
MQVGLVDCCVFLVSGSVPSGISDEISMEL